MKKVAIIGAGACGLLLANLLKDDFSITIIEKNNKLGKKILASGNGKCNFTNFGDYKNKYNNEFASLIVEKYNHLKVAEYLTSLGLGYRIDDENRAYPLSESSASFLQVLKNSLQNKVRILLESKVSKIEDSNEKITVYYNDNKEEYDYVVCASGSSASNLGSIYAYEYLEKYDINITNLSPSLVPIKVKETLKLIEGVRVKCLVKLLKNEKEIYREKGEALFKNDGLSGIVIYNMSSIINRDLNGNYKLSLDLLEDSKNVINSDDFTGLVNPKLLIYLNENNIKDIRNLIFTVKGLYNEEFAQVISGGVNLEEVNKDLSLKRNKRIFVGGEVLDCDGMCGGYNLQFAFSCAFLINESIRGNKDE